MFAFILTAFKWLGPSMFSMLRGVFTGGTLEKILDSIDKKFDNETEREKVKADVTKTYVNAQVQLLVGRTWWFQLFFVLPLGLWWTGVIFVSLFPAVGWTIHALPTPLDTWAGWIITALFVVDGSKSLIGRVQGH
jgi:hypothetical protein